MKKSSLRAFGIACFVIGALITLSQKSGMPFISQTKTEDDENYKARIVQLEQQLNEANEQLTLLKEDQQAAQRTEDAIMDEQLPEEENSLDTASENGPTDENVVGTLYIYGGLTPAEVAQKLKDIGIISNSVEMELFLAQPEYATSIQKGQFQLNSSMSIEQIANIITGRTTE
ncbi:hypothetical protein [Ureibacillus sinduriensis]|uniref:Aminodeoxychorismate lyase n=1 Tax=Ureibacillus sinduriensis BLB-1 = JCM 15800 TaxID=1384057 RepID=A0A0A3HPU2_9BACL|nr:hypothetical protein [Ureibacillus sinduriensis]KGR74601.1 hypothetical protein CD33_16040 [Ureibacillus sinduriensis BLB-1 = JCM 15800]